MKFEPDGWGYLFCGEPFVWGGPWEPKFAVPVVFLGDNEPRKKPGEPGTSGDTTPRLLE